MPSDHVVAMLVARCRAGLLGLGAALAWVSVGWAAPPPAPIGTATLLRDGTIVLQLRAETAGALGDAELRYTPTDPRYGMIRDHLPGLRVGTAILVPPFE